MPTPNAAALDFFLTRRSRPQKTLTTPVPTRDELEPLLTAALRVPDHGKLEPWRLMVLDQTALANLVPLVQSRGAALGKDDAEIAKGVMQYETGNLAVVVIESPDATAKVPVIEQTYSAGAVCLSLLNAALAAGWGANWLSGWASHDRDFVEQGLGLATHERIAGLIHIGTEKATPPERPRPNLAERITWHSA